MDLELLVSRVKAAGVSIGALNGKLLVLDPAKRLPDDLCDELDDCNDALVQYFQRKARRQDAWWRRQLGDSFAATALAAPFGGGDDATSTGTARLALPPQVASDLRALGSDSAAEAVTGLAWSWLLSRYTGVVRAGYFAATSSRSLGLSGIADMKGLVVNLHPVAVTLPAASALCALAADLAAARERNSEYGYPGYTDHNRFADRVHTFDTVLVFDRAGRPAGTPGIELCSLSALAALGLKGVLIVADDSAAGTLTLEFQYAAGHWNAAAAQGLLAHLAAVLGQLASAMAAGTPLHRIELAAGAERARLLAWGDGGAGAAPDAAWLHQLVERAAAMHPDRTAVLWRGETVSYAELNRRANRLAHHLLAQRGQAGAVVGICMQRTPALIVAMLAVLKAGCAYLPLDPVYPAARLDFMLADAGAAIVIADASSAGRVAGGMRQVIVPGAAQDGESVADITAAHAGLDADSLAYVIYTSGSTGVPKGVRIAHGAACGFLQWASAQFSAEEVRSVLCATSVCFDLSIFEIFLPLVNSARAVLVDSLLELAQDPQPDVSLINSVPSAMAELVRNGGIPASVLTVCLAGEPLHRKLVDQVYAHAGVAAVYNLYGPSEYTTYATIACVPRTGAGAPRIGRPLAGTRLCVLDADGALAPAGVAGELHIGGRQLATGYIGRPELTAERFVADPLATDGAALVYRTGDFVRWSADGELEFIGRRDDQVKLRGFRIELGEIEARLNAIDIVEVAAVAVRQEREGAQDPGEQCLVAYVVPTPGADHPAAREALKKQLAATLPAHMVPHMYVFLPQLPLTLNGKTDRKRLPALDGGDLQSGRYAAPRNDTERVLCGHFQKLLGQARVGVDDDFFALGGHSLLVFRLLILVRNTLGVDLPLKALFEAPTVAQLALRIAETRTAPALPQLERCSRDQPLPASPGQQRFWFLYSADPADAEYNLPLAFELRGALDTAACGQALGQLLARHEVLRTILSEENGQLFQHITEARPAAVRQLDFSHLAPLQAAAAARAAFAADRAVPFRLDADIPVRFTLARLGAGLHQLQISLHHVSVDGWSVNLILEEFARLYDHYAHGAELVLPELSLQYADFAQWQRRCLDGATLDALRAHWQRALEGAPRLHALPLDHPRPAVQRGVGRALRTVIDADLLARFKTVCASQGATLFMGLQTVYAALLGRWSGSDDIVTGTPVAGRTVAAAEPLVGFFMNSVALRNRIGRDASFASLVGAARGMVLGALEAQQFPFDALVSELALRRDPGYQPVFQAWFVLQSQTAAYPAMQSLELAPLARRDQDERMVHFDLSLNATELDQRLELLWEYQHDLFDAATIAWLGDAIALLLERAAQAPEAALLDVALPARAVPPRLPQPAAEPTRDPLERYAQQVRQRPDAVAVKHRDGTLSYAGLEARVARLADLLAQRGTGPGAVVPVRMAHGAGLVVVLLAILRCGAAYVLAPAGGDLPVPDLADSALLAACYAEPDAAAQQAIGIADAAQVWRHLEAQAASLGLGAGSKLLILPQTLHYAPLEWLLGLALGASLLIEDAMPAAVDGLVATLTPGLLAGLAPAGPAPAAIHVTGATCASWLAWQWAARTTVVQSFGLPHAPFLAAEPVVPGRPVVLGAATAGSDLPLLDAYGHACAPGVAGSPAPGAARLRLGHDGRYREAAASRFMPPRGLALPLSELEQHIGTVDGVAGVALDIVGAGPAARLVARVATPRTGAARQDFVAELGATLQALLPACHLPDVVIVTGTLPLAIGGGIDRELPGAALAAIGRQAALLDSLALPATRQPGWDAILDGGRAELRLALPAALPAALPGAAAPHGVEALLGGAYAMLMALELKSPSVCLSAATLDAGLPLALDARAGAQRPLAHGAVLPCVLAEHATVREAAVALAPWLDRDHAALLASGLAAGLPVSLQEGGADYGRPGRSAQCQFLFQPAGGGGMEQVAGAGAIGLAVVERADGYVLAWRYDSASYAAERVVALSRRYQRLVALLLDDPGLTLAAARQRLDAGARDRVMGLKNRFVVNTL